MANTFRYVVVRDGWTPRKKCVYTKFLVKRRDRKKHKKLVTLSVIETMESMRLDKEDNDIVRECDYHYEDDYNDFDTYLEEEDRIAAQANAEDDYGYGYDDYDDIE